MRTTSVYVINLCVPCENRCKYCLLSYNGQIGGIDYKRSEKYAKKFYDWIKENRPELGFIFSFGYSMEHPKLLEAIDFLNSVESPMGRFLQFDGMKFRTGEEIRELLLNLREHGIELIDLTFYGTEEYHDRFAARKGDFSYMMSILKVANEVGMPVTVDVPVSHENAEQLENLKEELEQYQMRSFRIFVPHAEGRGVLLEKDWVKSGESFELENRAVALTLTPENIDMFEAMDFTETLSYLEKLDEDYYSVIPPMEELMAMYGDEECELFYSARDLYLKYQRRYIKENGIEIYDINDERQCFSRRY